MANKPPQERDALLTKFGQRLRSAREAVHPPVTQRDVANRLGISFSAVNLWEQSKAFPKPEYLVELSKWFSVSVDWLLSIEQSPRKSVALAAGTQLMHSVPIVAPQSLNRWSWDVAMGAVQTEIAYPERTAAAIIVSSDSLASIVSPGDFAVLSKSHQWEPGNIVLAAIGRSEPVLRRYIREGGDDLLVADDQRFPTHRLDEGTRIIARLVETVRRRVIN